MADISYYLTLPYTKVLKRDDEGDVIATIAELDGCMADGRNESEALLNLTNAQTAWLEHAIAAGQVIPLPAQEEVLPSGKFIVRVPRSLHQRLIALARKDETSLNQLMLVAAVEHVARREASTQVRAQVTDISAWRAEPSARWEVRGGAPSGKDYLQQVRQRKAIGGEDDSPHAEHRRAAR